MSGDTSDELERLVHAVERNVDGLRAMTDVLHKVVELVMDLDNRLALTLHLLEQHSPEGSLAREEFAAVLDGWQEKRAELARLQRLADLRAGRLR